jgi:hypothetical protein
MPASVETTAPLPGLSPVADKPIIAAFDAEGFSASGGLLTLREIEQRLGLAPRLAVHIADPREPTQVVHPIADIVRFRMLMIAAGYEDGNDADVLRHDPMFKLAMGRLPTSEPLCSQSTISRLENLPDRRSLLRMGYGMIDFYCDSFRQVPRRIVLDIDDHFDAAHGEQELRVFNPSAGLPPASPLEPLPAPPTTMSTASRRLWCSMAMAAWLLLFCARQNGRADVKLSCCCAA